MSQHSAHTSGQPPQVLVGAIRKLLRPLVRLMLSHQITYPFLMNLLKSLYVEVAEQEFGVDGKRQSDSRINLLTGVHRKDVKRLRAELEQPEQMPSNISIGAQLIAHWLGSGEFLDEDGQPRPLPLRAEQSEDGEISFDSLVERVCKKDIRPRVILDEWTRLGIAHLDDEGRVALDTGAFTPDKGFDEKVFFFGKNLHDHISASTHNLLGNKPAFFDRSVYYDRLSARSVRELTELGNEIGMQALRTVNRKALSLQQRDANQPEAEGNAENVDCYRMNFGIFNYNTRYSRHEAKAQTDNETKHEDDNDA